MENDRELFEAEDGIGEEEFSLESILAEYKGSAFIDGDKKTPPDILNAKTEEILRELLGTDAPAAEEPDSHGEAEEPVPEPESEPEPAPEPQPAPEREVRPVPEPEPEKPVRSESPDDTQLFGGVTYADPDATRRFSSQVRKDMEDLPEKPERKKGGGLFSGRLKKKAGRKKPDDDIIPFDTFAPAAEEEPEPEPDFAVEARRFHAPLASLTVRSFVSLLICIAMLIITFAASGKAPTAGAGAITSAGILLIMQLVVMLLGIDVLITGVNDIVKFEPGPEALALVSCVITLAGGIVSLASGTCGEYIPFSLLSSFSLLCAMHGKKLWNCAMYASLKAAAAPSAPKSVVLDDCIEDRTALKKITCGKDGFYRKLCEADISETVYGKAAPLLFLAAIVFSLIASVGHGRPESFAGCFAAMTAMAASFPAALAYSLPFYIAAISAKKTGGAIAGWGGACDIYSADGALVTDDDVFPAGTVRLTGVKLFESAPQDKAIRYTASVIIESESCSARAFAELLKSQRLSALPVEDFSSYEGGGIGGSINGEAVLVGSSAFMNLMSIRVPKGMEARGAVFAAVDGELIAVFTVEFAPANSVRTALVSMQNTRTGMLFAVRDFNVTPHMVEQKFQTSADNIELISVGDCYKLSSDSRPKGAETLAVVSRDGLGPFAEVITKGRMLKTAVLLGTLVSVVGGAVGVLLMFLLCSGSTLESIKPTGAFIYMLAVQVVVSVLARLTLKAAK